MSTSKFFSLIRKIIADKLISLSIKIHPDDDEYVSLCTAINSHYRKIDKRLVESEDL